MSPDPARPRLSVVIEWANTRLHGVPRARRLLDALVRQWDEIVAGEYPASLPPTAAAFLKSLDPRAELVVVTGESVAPDLAEGQRLGHFDCSVHVAEGLEYYPLKSFGAERASGDLLLFVDSDVLPEEGWLAHLLGSLARPDIDVVCGQTYVAPSDLFAKAFALGWTYELRDPSGPLMQPTKFYANNILFRTELFRRVGFRPVGRRSRGAVSLLRQDLDRLGVSIWENRMARVAHPPPTSFRHMVVRALAHGRDHYLTHAEGRSLGGLSRSLGVAVRRLARGFRRSFRERRRVDLPRRAVPAVLLVIFGYYAFFALGGILTHAHPEAMSRHFRV